MQTVITPQDCIYYVRAYYAGGNVRCIYHGETPQNAADKYLAACKNCKIVRTELWSHGKACKVNKRQPKQYFVAGKVISAEEYQKMFSK